MRHWRYRFILAIIVLAFFNTSVFAQPLPSTKPLDLIQEIKNGDDGVKITDHIGPIRAVGDYVYAGVIYEGLINTFKRDPATGKLIYQGACDVGKKASFGSLVFAGGHLYGNGGSGHWIGDQASRGLHWFDIDQAAGMLTEKGSFDIPISSGLVAGPDGKSLYLLLKNGKLVSYTIGPDGTPAKAQELQTNIEQGDNLTISPDGQSVYFLTLNDSQRTLSIAHIQTGPGGAMTLEPACDIKQLIADSGFARGKWGFGWGHGLFLSPDGHNAYVDFYNYGAKSGLLAILTRSADSGDLTYRQRVDTVSSMVRMIVAFEPDGAFGYFGSGAETCGNCVGAFSRDPSTGLLTFAAVEPAARHRGPCSIELDAAHGCLYVGGWTSQTLMVFKTHPRPTRVSKYGPGTGG